MRSTRWLRAAVLATAGAAAAAAGCDKGGREAKARDQAPAAVAQVPAPPPAVPAPAPVPPVPGANPVPAVPPPVPGVPPAAPVPVPGVPAPPTPAPPVPEPPAPGTTTPPPTPTDISPSATTPPPAKPVEYPKTIDGRDLTAWLKEIAYTTGLVPLNQPDPQMREMAIRNIPGFGPAARKPALKPLIAVIQNDPDPGVRYAAINVIALMGYEEDTKEKATLMGREAVGAIKSRLAKTDNGSGERLTCVRALASFGSDGMSSVATLRSYSGDPSYETRIAVANALGRVAAVADEQGDPTKEMTAAYQAATGGLLSPLMTDPCASVRMEAIQSLILLGPPKVRTAGEYAKAVEPFVVAVTARIKVEKDRSVIAWLRLLHCMYDGSSMDANVKEMARMVRSPEGSNPTMVRVNTLTALSVLGFRAQGALEAIVEALMYEDPFVVGAAINCLPAFGTAAVRAMPELQKIADGAKDPPKPDNAPKDWKPDTSLRDLAKKAIPYVKGEKKLADEVAPPKPK